MRSTPLRPVGEVERRRIARCEVDRLQLDISPSTRGRTRGRRRRAIRRPRRWPSRLERQEEAPARPQVQEVGVLPAPSFRAEPWTNTQSPFDPAGCAHARTSRPTPGSIVRSAQSGAARPSPPGGFPRGRATARRGRAARRSGRRRPARASRRGAPRRGRRTRSRPRDGLDPAAEAKEAAGRRRGRAGSATRRTRSTTSQGERERSATEPTQAKRKSGTAERRIAQTSPVLDGSGRRGPGSPPLAADEGRKTISSASRTSARPPASFPPQTTRTPRGGARSGTRASAPRARGPRPRRRRGGSLRGRRSRRG